MVFAMLATPFFLFAQTTGANPTSDYFGQDTQVQNVCVDLRYNLIYRSRDARTNGEVSDLQDFLISNGYLSGEPTGYFGAVTLAAVRKFQSAAGIGMPTTPGYGAIGPKSRAKIKAMTCGGAVATESSLPATTLAPSPAPVTKTPPTIPATTATPLPAVITPLPFGCTPNTYYNPMTGAPCTPVAVVLPNGGEKLLKGTTIEILWAQPSSIDTEIRLLGYLSPACENPTATCDGSRTPAIYSIAKNPPIVIDKQRVYKWVVGETRDINIGGATNNYVVPDGLYKIQVCFWTNVTKGCDSSDNYFSITSPQTTATTTIAVPQPIIVPTTSLPDLTVVGMGSSRTLSGAVENTDVINFNVDIRNNGGDVTTPFTVAVKGSGDAQYGPVGFYAASVIQGIRSGETKNVYIGGAYLMPNGKELSGTMTAIADHLSNVAESNEANNSLQKYFTIPALSTVLIKPFITLTSPNGGEVWQKGTQKTISWVITNNPINHIIKLKLFKGGVFYQDLVPPTAAGPITTGPYGSTGGSLPWTVPLTLPDGSDYIVEATDYNADGVTVGSFDYGNAAFRIETAPTISIPPTSTTSSVPSITITSPNGGEVLTVGQTKRITWNSSSVIDKVYIGYSFGTGSLNWIATNIPNTGYYDWNVNIGNTTNTQVKISITGYQTGTGSWSDQSDNFFTVNPVVSTPAPTVTLTSAPSSIDKRISTSETIAIGLVASIEGLTPVPQQYSAFTWELIGNAPAGVTLSVEGAFYAVLRGTPTQTGNYVFAIRLRNPGAPGVYTDIPVTLNVFSPVATTAPTITLISPLQVTVGTTTQVQLDGSNFTPSLNIAIIGPGADTSVVPTAVSQDGKKLTFNFPSTITTTGNYSVQVYSLGGTGSNFLNLNLVAAVTQPSLLPTITFTASPESITSGQTSILSWSSTNATSCASSGDGASWGWPSARYITGAQYTPALTTTQTYTMSCTGAGGTTSKSVTVTVAAAPTTVTSTPTIRLISPNGGETIASNSQYTVQWNTSNYAATTLINIYLFSSAVTPPTETSYNTGFVSTLVSSTPNDGSEVVSIPSGLAGTTYFIRVLGRDMTATGTAFPNGCLAGCRNDDSDAPFTISAASTQTASVIGALSGLSTTSNAPMWKYTWTRNLEVGSQYSDDITALQTALIKEGVYTGEVTGGFYSQTYLAVKAFQSKYGIESTGFVGPTTREKLNSIYEN